MQRYIPAAQDEPSAPLEILAGLLFMVVVAVVLIQLTALYGVLPTDALDYSDIALLAP